MINTIPITLVAIVENMYKQLPQIDFTFGIGDIVGSIALLVSAFTFYISHTQASQSEQIKTSREIWARIYEMHEECGKKLLTVPSNAYLRQQGVLHPLLLEMDYFAYLILSKEIKDKMVLGYYRRELTMYINIDVGRYLSIIQLETGADRESKKRAVRTLSSNFPHLTKLISAWEIEL